MSACTTCGQALRPDAIACDACGALITLSRQSTAPLPDRTATSAAQGRVIGNRYQLGRRLGAGGMGTVFLATQLGVGNKVALKFLAPQYSGDETIRRRFTQEGRLSVEVTHPGAAQLLDAGADEQGALWLAFEYVEGEDLREVLKREGRLSFEEARDVALKVAEVLAYAHARGVVHRDIKPENLRLRRDLAGTHVKVLDFGIARLMEGGPALTAPEGFAGTPRYMAPEQINGGRVDARTDVYALGLVLYEMLAGRTAIRAEVVGEMLMEQLHAPLPRLNAPAVDAFLERACAKDPASRLPDMGRFVAELRQLAAPVPPAAATARTVPEGSRASPPRGQLATPMPPPPAQATTEAQGRRGSVLVPLLAGALLVVTGGAGTWALLRSQAAPAAPAADPCPSLSYYAPELARLSVPQLEARVLKARYLRPSDAKKQLETLRTSAEGWADGQRGCMYRTALVGSVASEPAVLKASPELWGETKEVEELQALFLELPMTKRWSLGQRRSLLGKIDTLFIANLDAKEPGDKDYWRRMYYGILLTCEVTDEVLATLKAKRPGSCLNLAPDEG